MSSPAGSAPPMDPEQSVVRNEDSVDVEIRNGGDEEVEQSEYNSALNYAVAYDVDDFLDDLEGYLENIETVGSVWTHLTQDTDWPFLMT
ncbi:hypothetical protein E6O75_ATG03704 [Venturia nashicola]|uniref:Uncharacterized protein n=1 Tax=Venturia nashicola TaxID=86259 RepID=A0A4Z1PJA9_9PEZI|nr:hypothetical protein E6O75_ATG03704 [Venturia nashicola]